MNKNFEPSKEVEQQASALRLSDPDLQQEASTEPKTLPLQPSEVPSSCPFHFVALRMGGNGGTHQPSRASASLIDEVPLEKLQDMTERFYEQAFQDATLDTFIHSQDDPHATRFAKWIHQKLSGSRVWDEDRESRPMKVVQLAGGREMMVQDRTSAHVAAWYSTKRPANDVGRHFQLDECRVWMRLHFWAMREAGLLEVSPSFADYYVRFIGHFVRVYESMAPVFARESLRWSADPANIQTYINNGRIMKDVMGLTVERALAQIPESESEDFEWPYNKSPQSDDTF